MIRRIHSQLLTGLIKKLTERFQFVILLIVIGILAVGYSHVPKERPPYFHSAPQEILLFLPILLPKVPPYSSYQCLSKTACQLRLGYSIYLMNPFFKILSP